MQTVAVYAVLVALPASAFYAAFRALERWSEGTRRPDAQAVTAGRPVERLVADLRRLEQEHSRITAGDEPSRAARLRAVRLAYDDTLRDCCRCVGLPEPGRPPWSAVTRLQTEAALAQAGLVW